MGLKDGVSSWLSDLGLKVYAPGFLDEGFDDMDVVANMTAEVRLWRRWCSWFLFISPSLFFFRRAADIAICFRASCPPTLFFRLPDQDLKALPIEKAGHLRKLELAIQLLRQNLASVRVCRAPCALEYSKLCLPSPCCPHDPMSSLFPQPLLPQQASDRGDTARLTKTFSVTRTRLRNF